jgi:hypothetical protein
MLVWFLFAGKQPDDGTLFPLSAQVYLHTRSFSLSSSCERASGFASPLRMANMVAHKNYRPEMPSAYVPTQQASRDARSMSHGKMWMLICVMVQDAPELASARASVLAPTGQRATQLPGSSAFHRTL